LNDKQSTKVFDAGVSMTTFEVILYGLVMPISMVLLIVDDGCWLSPSIRHGCDVFHEESINKASRYQTAR